MAARRSGGTRSETIRCPYCGEFYADSYKHCPFCDEIPMDDEFEEGVSARSRGGKRLMTNSRGGGYGGRPSMGKRIGRIISLAIIAAAIIIVVTQILPLMNRGHGGQSTVSPSSSVQPSGGTDVSPTPGGNTAEPSIEPSQQTPAGQTATGFTLDKTEFSLSDRYPEPITLKVVFTPSGSVGEITWSSSDPEIVQVDKNGTVSYGSKRGSATITATMAGGVSQTCLVYNNVTSGTASASGSGASSLSLNRTDFTLGAGQSFQVKVSGTSSTPTWSIGNTAVATVSGDGTVSYAGQGHTTLTCSVDGQTLTCVVRCN